MFPLSLVSLIESASDSSLSQGLVALWKMSDLSDAVGSNTLSNFGSVNFTTDPGKASFSGSNYLEAANSASLQAGDIDFTIAIRVYLVNLNFYGILNKWSSASENSEYEIISNSNVSFFVRNTGNTANGSVSTTSGLITSGWNTILAEHDSANNLIKITCNGGSTASASWSGGIRVGSVPLTFGAYSVSQAAKVPAGTKIDYAAIWKRLLTSEEKAQVDSLA